MSFLSRVRNLFSSPSLEDEAAEREEYGVPDRGEAELDRDRAADFATSEAAEAAENELRQLERPDEY